MKQNKYFVIKILLITHVGSLCMLYSVLNKNGYTVLNEICFETRFFRIQFDIKQKS